MQWFISSGNNLTQCIFDEYENRHRTMRKIKYGQNNKQKGRREWYNERTKTIARVLTCSGRKTKIVHNLQYYTTRKRLESNLTRILLKFRLGIVILQVLSVLLDDRCRSGNGSCFNAALLAGVVEVVGCISSLEAWGWAGASPAASDEETFSEETAWLTCDAVDELLLWYWGCSRRMGIRGSMVAFSL